MKVLIADDNDPLRDALILFFAAEGGIATETARTVDGICDSIAANGPFDLVLLDLDMPGMDGLAGLRRVLALDDCPRVAVMAGRANHQVAEKAIALGAAGFVPKSLPVKSMVNAVRFMARGERYAPLDFMTAADEAPENPIAARLTERELQVAKGLTQGRSNKEIARDLDILEPTVKLHIKTLSRKLGASNRTQAAMIAREAGLF